MTGPPVALGGVVVVGATELLGAALEDAVVLLGVVGSDVGADVGRATSLPEPQAAVNVRTPASAMNATYGFLRADNRADVSELADLISRADMTSFRNGIFHPPSARRAADPRTAATLDTVTRRSQHDHGNFTTGDIRIMNGVATPRHEMGGARRGGRRILAATSHRRHASCATMITRHLPAGVRG